MHSLAVGPPRPLDNGGMAVRVFVLGGLQSTNSAGGRQSVDRVRIECIHFEFDVNNRLQRADFNVQETIRGLVPADGQLAGPHSQFYPNLTMINPVVTVCERALVVVHPNSYCMAPQDWSLLYQTSGSANAGCAIFPMQLLCLDRPRSLKVAVFDFDRRSRGWQCCDLFDGRGSMGARKFGNQLGTGLHGHGVTVQPHANLSMRYFATKTLESGPRFARPISAWTSGKGSNMAFCVRNSCGTTFYFEPTAGGDWFKRTKEVTREPKQAPVPSSNPADPKVVARSKMKGLMEKITAGSRPTRRSLADTKTKFVKAEHGVFTGLSMHHRPVKGTTRQNAGGAAE